MKTIWNSTRLTRLLNLQYPIIQGPFGGGLSTVNLVSAVSSYGALGGYGAYQLHPSEITELSKNIRQQTNGPYALNLWVPLPNQKKAYTFADHKLILKHLRPALKALHMEELPMPMLTPPDFEEQVEALIAARPAVFSFVFGIPSQIILEACRRHGIVTIGAATTVEEGIALEMAGVDVIVASGFEAGGHRPSFLKPAEDSLMSTFVLLQVLKEKVKVPIIAAGGIATAESAALALRMGASGVQIGTAFLACEESGASMEHRAAIFSERANETVLTSIFTGRLARGSKSILSEQLKDIKPAPFPYQSELMAPLRREATARGKHDYITYWMGQAAPLVREKTVHAFMQQLINGLNTYFDY